MNQYLYWKDKLLLEHINEDLVCLYVMKEGKVERSIIKNR